MSEHREESIRRKLVQRGIVDVRPAVATKKRIDWAWLAVYLRDGGAAMQNNYPRSR